MRLRPVRLDRLDRAAILCAAAPARGPNGGRFRRADGPQCLARAEAEAGRNLQDKNPRRVVQDHGRHRHLLRTGPDHERGAAPSAHGGKKYFCRAPRRNAARPRAALFTHAVGDPRGGDGGYCGADAGVEKFVGWAKALFAPCPPNSSYGARRWWARGVYHRARVRATRWLCPPYENYSAMVRAVVDEVRRGLPSEITG